MREPGLYRELTKFSLIKCRSFEVFVMRFALSLSSSAPELPLWKVGGTIASCGSAHVVWLFARGHISRRGVPWEAASGALNRMRPAERPRARGWKNNKLATRFDEKSLGRGRVAGGCERGPRRKL